MANLLLNGNFSASAGEGATSTAGPGWQTDYLVPSGGQLFAGPGAAAARYAYFTTTAAQVCNGQGATIPALGGKSMAVNVGGVGDIIRWNNVLLTNGARYRMSADAAVVNFPYSIAMRVDGETIMEMPAPTAAGVWQTTSREFVWEGTTGLHTVSLSTNQGAASGNDHAFDNFVLERADLPVEGCCLATGACYRDISPCEVTPAQENAVAVPGGLFLHTYDRATLNNNTGRPMRAGSGACGSRNASDVEAAGYLIDGNLNGLTSAAVFNPIPPANQNLPIDAEMVLEFETPHNNIQRFRVYHGYGAVLNDSDGIRQGRVRLFDSTGTLLTTATWIGANNGSAQDVDLGGSFDDVALVIFDEVLRWTNQNQNCAGIRELQAVGGWHSTLTWACGGTRFTGFIQGDAAGVVFNDGQLTQTNGPHTLTFASDQNDSWTAEIITDNPGMFSSLVANADNPEIVISGDGVASFTVSFVHTSDTRRALVDLSTEPPSLFDMSTGEALQPGGFEIVPCGS